MPRISVIIPARNAAKTIARALRSAVKQTREPDEILVVNDASTDDTCVIAHGFSGVRVISLETASGAAAARNAGVAAAAGQWVAFLDADDEWLPQKLAVQSDFFWPDTDLVFCASQEYSPAGVLLGDTFRGRKVPGEADMYNALLEENFIATPTVVSRRAAILAVGGFDSRLKIAEDQDLWLKIAHHGRMAYVAQTLVRVHVQPQSLSAYRPGDQERFVLPMIERHLNAAGLSQARKRRILAARRLNAARIAFCHGAAREGGRHLLRAALLKAPLWLLLKTAARAAFTLLRPGREKFA